MENIIEVKNLTKFYKKNKAIDDLSFDVHKGEILGFLGPNGSGKSTTINCILSLLNFSKGSIKIFGKEMKPNAYDLKRKIGVVFQDVAVFDELTVYDNIDYFCGLYITDKSKRKKYIEEAINLVGLKDFKKYVPRDFMSWDIEKRSEYVSENTFRISITSFVDQYNFDIKSMQKECAHVITTDLKRIPFSSYNMIYRSKYDDQK